VSGENANLSLGTLCASYVSVVEKLHSLRDFRAASCLMLAHEVFPESASDKTGSA
jgi:hypothetical protein